MTKAPALIHLTSFFVISRLDSYHKPSLFVSYSFACSNVLPEDTGEIYIKNC
jgi:hypothetical protein